MYGPMGSFLLFGAIEMKFVVFLSGKMCLVKPVGNQKSHYGNDRFVSDTVSSI